MSSKRVLMMFVGLFGAKLRLNIETNAAIILEYDTKTKSYLKSLR